MAASIKITALRANVVVRSTEKNGKQEKYSDIFIMAGPLAVAKITRGYAYTEENALRDFKLNGKNYTKLKDFDAVHAMGLC